MTRSLASPCLPSSGQLVGSLENLATSPPVNSPVLTKCVLSIADALRDNDGVPLTVKGFEGRGETGDDGGVEAMADGEASDWEEELLGDSVCGLDDGVDKSGVVGVG